MATPFLNQLLQIIPEAEFDQDYILVNLDPDGSRRILRSSIANSGQDWVELVERFQRVFPSVPVVLWGPLTGNSDLRNALLRADNLGQYLPYPAADGIATFPVDDEVNQIPYQQDFVNHCCTFAHELLTDLQAHAPRLRHIDSWNAAPDLELDVDSIQRNRVGMRYYRGVLGYYYDRIVRFSSHPNDPDELGQFETDWRTELAEMQSLDSYVCGECRDEGGGSRLRDFIHHLEVAPWDTALDATVASGSGSSLRYTARLPRIDRGNPDRLLPHATRNVRTWVSNVPNVEGGWKSMMRDFNDSVKRWDRDPRVRMPRPPRPSQ